MDTPCGSYMSLEGLADLSVGRPLHHGILAHAVHVLLGPDDVGHHLLQSVVRESVVCARHVHLCGWRRRLQVVHAVTSAPASQVPQVLLAEPSPHLSLANLG